MADIQMEPSWTPPAGKSQPIQAIATSEPLLDEAAVRQAIANAEANNQDPLTATMDDYAQGLVNKTAQPAPVVQVPEKFLKSDGAVDVDKIKASTQALDTAIQNKETALSKSVDDYMREYQELETKFRTMPNPQKVQAQAPVVTPPAVPIQENQPYNYEDVVRQDFQRDPLMTMTRLMEVALEAKFAPIEQKEKSEKVRTNLQELASKDSRVLREDVYAAIQNKLKTDQDLWKLKNPHKAAWLEVKEELRLGEPSQAQAQPSRPLSPVLGGGTPPSAPSSQAPSVNGTIDLNALDLRNKDQEALGDEAVRRLLMGHRA